MVRGIQRGLDGCQFALGRALLDALKLGEEDRIARQVNKRADVEDLPACAPREGRCRRDKTEVGQGKNGDADKHAGGEVRETENGQRPLAADTSFTVVDDGQACR